MFTNSSFSLTTVELSARATVFLDDPIDRWVSFHLDRDWNEEDRSSFDLAISLATARRLANELNKVIAQADCAHQATKDDGEGWSTCMECGFSAEDDFFFHTED